jgi:hypothetical protein
MDNAHAAVWASLARLCLLARPRPRLSDAQAYADLAFEHRLDSRLGLWDLAEAFAAAANDPAAGDVGARAGARETAQRCLRLSLALGEDAEVRARLAALLPTQDDKDACRMFLSPRKGPALTGGAGAY